MVEWQVKRHRKSWGRWVFVEHPTPLLEAVVIGAQAEPLFYFARIVFMLTMRFAMMAAHSSAPSAWRRSAQATKSTACRPGCAVESPYSMITTWSGT